MAAVLEKQHETKINNRYSHELTVIKQKQRTLNIIKKNGFANVVVGTVKKFVKYQEHEKS